MISQVTLSQSQARTAHRRCVSWFFVRFTEIFPTMNFKLIEQDSVLKVRLVFGPSQLWTLSCARRQSGPVPSCHDSLDTAALIHCTAKRLQHSQQIWFVIICFIKSQNKTPNKINLFKDRIWTNHPKFREGEGGSEPPPTRGALRGRREGRDMQAGGRGGMTSGSSCHSVIPVGEKQCVFKGL